MRATDGLQTTINLGPVHRDDQAFSLQLSLRMSLPVPPRALPTRSRLRPSGRPSDPGPALPSPLERPTGWSCDRRGKPALVPAPGTRPFTFRRPRRVPSSGRGQPQPTAHRGPLGQGETSPCHPRPPGCVCDSQRSTAARAVPRLPHAGVRPAGTGAPRPAGASRSVHVSVRAPAERRGPVAAGPAGRPRRLQGARRPAAGDRKSPARGDRSRPRVARAPV